MISDQLSNEYAKLTEEISNLKLLAQAKAAELYSEMFANFLTKYESIVDSVWWNQWTPEYNDGEPCEFRRNELQIHYINIPLREEDDYDEVCIYDSEDLERLEKNIEDLKNYEADPTKYLAEHKKRHGYESRPYGSSEEYEEELEFAKNIVTMYPDLAKDFKEISNVFESIDEEICYALFGDPVKVIFTKTGYQVEDYETSY